MTSSTFTTDPGTTIGQVRLLISDTDINNAVYDDAEITAFLTIETGFVRMAAAMALDTIASNEALVAKKITTQDLATDGPAVAASLRAHAANLRALHRSQQADADAVSRGGFDVVDMGAPRPDWAVGADGDAFGWM